MIPSCSKNKQETLLKGSKLGEKTQSRGVRFTWKSTTKNKVVAEYALRDTAQPIGVAEYQLIESLPAALQTSLPSIEQIESELGDGE